MQITGIDDARHGYRNSSNFKKAGGTRLQGRWYKTTKNGIDSRPAALFELSYLVWSSVLQILRIFRRAARYCSIAVRAVEDKRV